MNEQYNGHENNISLPKPIEANPPSAPYEKQQSQAIETGQVSSGASSSTLAAGAPAASPDPQAQPVAMPASGIGASPQIADDVDLIEKEWVERAKRIVEQTKNDPYRQSEELHSTKDDYQTKRFNRDTNFSSGS